MTQRWATRSLGIACRIYAPVGGHEDLLAYLVRRLLGKRRQHVVRQPAGRRRGARRRARRRSGGSACEGASRSAIRAFLRRRSFSAASGAIRWASRSTIARRCDALSRRDERRAGVIRSAAPLVERQSGGQARRARSPIPPIAGAWWAKSSKPAKRRCEKRSRRQAARRRPGMRWAAKRARKFSSARPISSSSVAREAHGAHRARGGPHHSRRAVGAARGGGFLALLRGARARRFRAPARAARPDRRAQHARRCAAAASSPASARGTSRSRSSRARSRRRSPPATPSIAKPAEQTPLVAHEAVRLLHEAGVPADVLHFLPGAGETVGATLVRDPRIAGVAFTGSTETARAINAALAAREGPIVPFIAETGGLNAMIVDFDRAARAGGGRRAALRLRQRGPALLGAARALPAGRHRGQDASPCSRARIAELRVGDPMRIETDVGPDHRRARAERARSACAAHGARGKAHRRGEARARDCAAAASSRPCCSRSNACAARARGVRARSSTSCASRATGSTESARRSTPRATASRSACTPHRCHGGRRVARGCASATSMSIASQIGAVVGVQPFGGEGLVRHGTESRRPALSAALRRRARALGQHRGRRRQRRAVCARLGASDACEKTEHLSHTCHCRAFPAIQGNALSRLWPLDARHKAGHDSHVIADHPLSINTHRLMRLDEADVGARLRAA